jgi:hypothetical protein
MIDFSLIEEQPYLRKTVEGLRPHGSWPESPPGSLENAFLDAVRIHGACRYLAEFEIERQMRDRIFSSRHKGASNMNLIHIDKLLGL